MSFKRDNPGDCCCDCPSKEDSGLPDALTVAFGIGSTTADGMPADVNHGSCGDGGDAYTRFSFNSAIIEMLSSMTFDYVSTGGSCEGAFCCFLYEGRPDHMRECPEDLVDEVIELGPSPFDAAAIGGNVLVINWSGSSVDPETGPHNIGGTIPVAGDCGACCADSVTELGGGDYNLGTTRPCVDVFGNHIEWTTGILYIPGGVYATAELVICIQGNIVTICGTISLGMECEEVTGSGSWNGAYELPAACEPGPECVRMPAETTTSDTIGCGGNSSGSISFSATADLSAVSGADIWEKIKNYTGWASDFESVLCNCNPADCADTYRRDIQSCDILPHNCGGGINDTLDVLELAGAPVDRECYYSAGELDLSFSDA